jgi:heme/copper-type cytochrome/quinol oxidase subunit 2
MSELGKLLMFFGGILVLLGVLFVILGRTNLPIGRLPGDILYRGKNTTFYFPLTTSIIVSVVLSLVFYIVGRMRH